VSFKAQDTAHYKTDNVSQKSTQLNTINSNLLLATFASF